MLSPNLFNVILVFPILNVLAAFLKLFTVLHLPGTLGFGIISLTVLVRLIVHPFFKQQMHTARKMQEMKPHLDNLSKKHKKDPKKLQSEQMRLYQEAGINPAAGCVFAIIQIPIFLGLYNTLRLILSEGTGAKAIAEINKALYFPFLKIQSIDPNFLGFNLALSPAKGQIWYYYLIPVITAVLQFLQAKYTMPGAATPVVKDEKNNTKDDKKESSTGEDFQKAMNTQMKYFFPIMIGYFSYTLPVGLSLYWNIFSIFSIIQHIHLKKPTGISLSTGQNKILKEKEQ